MPRVRGAPVSQEEYEEWLGRCEEKEMLPDQFDLFQSTLRGELYGYNDAQIEKLWELKGNQTSLQEHGIQPLGVREAWGWHQRYAIQGLIGLWGFERVQEIRAEEGW